MNHYTVRDILCYSEDHEPLLKILAGIDSCILFKSFYQFLDDEFNFYQFKIKRESERQLFDLTSWYLPSVSRLIYAIKMNSFIFYKKLMMKIDKDLKFGYDKSVFLGACLGNEDTMIKKLLMDYENDPALYTYILISEGLLGASLSGNEKLIEYLLSIELPEGNNPLLMVRKENIVKKERILYGAILGNNLSGVEKFVEEYREMNLNLNLNRALRIACEKGRISIAKYLVEEGANDFNGAFGFTCEGCVDFEKGLEIMRFLKEKGATGCRNFSDCGKTIEDHIEQIEAEISWNERRRKEGKSPKIIDLINEIIAKRQGKDVKSIEFEDWSRKASKIKPIKFRILESKALKEIRFLND